MEECPVHVADHDLLAPRNDVTMVSGLGILEVAFTRRPYHVLRLYALLILALLSLFLLSGAAAMVSSGGSDLIFASIIYTIYPYKACIHEWNTWIGWFSDFP